MKNKYEVGDLVAAITSDGMIALPRATVIEVVWDDEGAYLNHRDQKKYCRASHSYFLDDGGFRWAEHCLRPINPDEYEETEEEQELVYP